MKRVLIIVLAWFAVLAVGSRTAGAAVVNVEKSPDGWRLLVDGEPFLIRGVSYDPAKVGESPHFHTLRDWSVTDDDGDGRIDTAYQSWVDADRDDVRDPAEQEVGDFQLMKDMGVNCLRVFHHASADPRLVALHPTDILHNHPPNKRLYRELFERFGIRVMIGDLLGAYTVGSGAPWGQGTDYRDLKQQENMLASVERMVKEFKDEPFLLLWALGNENDLTEWTNNNSRDCPAQYAVFVNEVARRIHEWDPDHPVCLINGKADFLKRHARLIPQVDIMGYNDYRVPGFDSLWADNAQWYGKPVLLTEYGTGYPPVEKTAAGPRLNEKRQMQMHIANWNDIERHAAGRDAPGNAIGGFAFTFLDDWWQDGEPWEHNLMYDGWHHEWNGLAAQGDGRGSPLKRQLREVYFAYQKLWNQDQQASDDE